MVDSRSTVDSLASKKRPPRRPMSVVEIVLVSGLVATATFLLTQGYYARYVQNADFFSLGARRELAPLLEQYGPTRHSRNIEEFIIRDFFRDRRGGVFLDVGANHYRDESNTYYLETALNWSGIAVEAQPEFGADYATHRPNTRFVAAFASDESEGTAVLFVPRRNHLVASSNYEFTVREGAPGRPREVPTATLNDILDAAGVEAIDFLSMDIELAEPAALRGLDVNRFRPSFVCIEAHPDVRQQILDYFAEHGYVLVGKYLRMDPYNLYFKPLEKPS